jgi:hypothetical protein
LQLKLQYDKGTLLIQGDVRVPNSNWDARSGAYRALALHYVDIKEMRWTRGYKRANEGQLSFRLALEKPLSLSVQLAGCKYLH